MYLKIFFEKRSVFYTSNCFLRRLFSSSIFYDSYDRMFSPIKHILQKKKDIYCQSLRIHISSSALSANVLASEETFFFQVSLFPSLSKSLQTEDLSIYLYSLTLYLHIYQNTICLSINQSIYLPFYLAISLSL